MVLKSHLEHLLFSESLLKRNDKINDVYKLEITLNNHLKRHQFHLVFIRRSFFFVFKYLKFLFGF